MTERTGKRWRGFRIGCLAILCSVGLLLVWSAVVVGLSFFGSRSESVTRQSLRQAASPSPDRPVGAGRVVLDFTVGEFLVRPGNPGDPIRVEAEFDTSAYALEEVFEPSTGDGWTYRVTFRQTGLIKDGGLRVLFGASFPEIRVYLPPDVPIALEGRFGKGGATVELGGLWLTDVDLGLDKGALAVGFDEPPAAPLPSIRLHGRQGSLAARALGKASPTELDVAWSMGGSLVDLSGSWRNDADVRVRSMMGGSTLFVPGGVNVEGLEGRDALPAAEEEELPRPTLRMRTASLMGGMEIITRE
jgi:hypothetical protein